MYMIDHVYGKYLYWFWAQKIIIIKNAFLYRFKELLNKNNLKIIPMVFTEGVVAPGEGIVFGGPYPG